MIVSSSTLQQDNSISRHVTELADTAAFSDVKPVFDTTASCYRNSISGVTFHDPGSFIKNLEFPESDKTILVLAGKSKIISETNTQILISHLKPGEIYPETQKQPDWVIIVIVAAALLLTLVRSSKQGFQSLAGFFLFRGYNDSGTLNQTGLLQWQTTIRNLSSFIIISLFIYKSASYFDAIPAGMNRLIAWLICLTSVVLAFTLRNIICVITGNLSGTSDVFNEYLTGVYQSYHFSALILALLTVLIAYAAVLPSRVFIIAGFVAFGLLYLFRIIRLLIIFLNRNMSILYLILYLCALEILPIAIAIRYFSVFA